MGINQHKKNTLKKPKKSGKSKEITPMETSKFDVADYLDRKEMIAEYLNIVLEEGDNPEVINAIGHVIKVIGMSKIAEETGLSRPSLYKALSDGAKIQFANIIQVLKAIGKQIQVNPFST